MAVSSVFTNLLLPLPTPASWRAKLEIDLTTLGVSAFMQTLLDDANATAALATLGIIGASYVPTLTNTVNVDASTAFANRYLRIGAIYVIVSGEVGIDATTAAGTFTEVQMTLPLASDLTAATHVAGVGAAATPHSSLRITADTVTNRARFVFAAQSTANLTYSFIFGYPIL
jgi:hypothetical protein